MRLKELAGRRIAVWGAGSEGLSAVAAIRRALPAAAVTVLDEAELSAEAGERLAADPAVAVVAGPEAPAALAGFDVVVRSPGVSLYRREIETARDRGTVFTSATQIWFDEGPPGAVVCVTGTKGKSTTAALAAHLLAAAGRRVELAGNLGRPLLDLLEISPAPEVWVVEISSYQASDLDASPRLAVLLNLFPEHLDWHGDARRYYLDKLNLFRRLAPGRAIVNATDPITREFLERFDEPILFNDPRGLHAAGGWILDGERRLAAAEDLSLRGGHNLENACAALAAVRALGIDPGSVAGALAGFEGLPHRLRVLGERGGVVWVDDSISTVPQSALAAIEAFSDRPVTILLGGHDRGLDYAALVERLLAPPVHAAITMGASGPRIAAALRERLGSGGDPSRPRLREAADLGEAVALAREITPAGGAVLLSPAAASYGPFRDFRQRGRAFAAAAGFERDRSAAP